MSKRVTKRELELHLRRMVRIVNECQTFVCLNGQQKDQLAGARLVLEDLDAA